MGKVVGARGGVTIVLRMGIVTSATPNVLGVMNHTMRNARKRISVDD